MGGYGTNEASSLLKTGVWQRSIIGQLFQVAKSANHVDELFLWLAQTIVQYFQVQVAQIWTGQGGQPSAQLRALARQDTSLPEYVVVNDQMAAMAGLLISERQNYGLQPVNKSFTFYQASLFGRYGLNYFTAHYLSSGVLLPPPKDALLDECQPIPLALSLLLFLRQPSSHEVFSTIHLILEQAILAASHHQLLLPTRALAHPVTDKLQQEVYEAPLDLFALFPHRLLDSDLLTSSNPLARSVDITHKPARRLYVAMNGCRSVEELGAVTGLEEEEMIAALQWLINQRRVELRDAYGQLIDPETLFFC